MKITIKNPFEVNENDSLGTALLKGAAEGYIKGTLAAGLGLGILALGVMAISKKDDSNEEEEKSNDDLDKELEEMEQELEKELEEVKSN